MTKLFTRRSFSAVLSVVAAAVCCSCQQNVMPTVGRSGGSVGTRTYADSVVHIGQVDPAYRPYFQSQNGANYSLADQRKAYLAAAQTARTPVRESDYRPSDERKKSVASTGSKSRGKNAVADTKKSRTSVQKRSVVVKKSAGTRRS